MPNPATVRERRLRKTKAQLIDEIDTLEQRAAAIEATSRSVAPMRATASDRYRAHPELAELARFPSENPSPVLRVMLDGTVLYANDAAIAVNGLLKGRKKSTLARDLAGVCAEASRTAEVQETEFESGDRVFAFSIAPVAGETYINIYGRDITERERAEEVLAALKAHRKELIEPKAVQYHGRTVKLMGDGTLMELPLFNLPGLTSRRRHSGMAQRRISSHLPRLVGQRRRRFYRRFLGR